MRGLGYGQNYLYPHDYEGAVVGQSYMPEELLGRVYYTPSERGHESRIREYLERTRQLKGAAARSPGARKNSPR
jgi:putative ATPase